MSLWTALGSKLLARGGQRLELALHLATVGADGGASIGTEEEQRIVEHFLGLFDWCVSLAGHPAARALWFIFQTDAIQGTHHSRCPVFDSLASPGDHDDWTAMMRVALIGYVLSVIASAGEADVAMLRRLVTGDVLPYGVAPYSVEYMLANGWDMRQEYRNEALSNLVGICSNDEIVAGLESWILGQVQEAAANHVPPVYRLGALAWMASVLTPPAAEPAPAAPALPAKQSRGDRARRAVRRRRSR